MVLAVPDAGDSGTSGHLVNDKTLLIESAKCIKEIVMADSESLHLTRVGSVRLKVIARGVQSTVTLTDVHLVPRKYSRSWANDMFFTSGVLYHRTMMSTDQ